MKRAVKGNFGYIKSKRLNIILRTAFFFGISLALFAAGYITTGKKENLLTVVAILGCLPACKSMVNMIMLLRAKGCSENARSMIAPAEGRLIGMYDMYFTSYQKNFDISHMALEGKVVLGYTESITCDLKACEEHIQDMLKQGGFKGMTVKISNDILKYCDLLEAFNQKKQENDPEKDDEARVILYEVSL